ncbi:hypothetical protein KC723_02450 [Candidatus Kaiserbacteria bacterium]|nr:hypothetical protein [Candidatus Kaiserbacteria bacterium]
MKILSWSQTVNKIIASFVFILTIFWLATPAIAANYTVSPLLIDHTVEKRTILSETITIKNFEKHQNIRVYASVHEVTLGEGGEIKEFTPPSMSDNTNSVTSWIEINRGRLQIEPGGELKIPMTIRINPKAQPGEYHAFVGFGNGSNRTIAEKKTMDGIAPGVIIRISLDEKKNVFLKLKQFTVDRFITDVSKGGVSYTVTNPGEEAISPSGEIIFYDNRGVEVGAMPVNDSGHVINPGEEYEFTSALPEHAGFGKRKAFLSLEYGTNQLASIHDTAFFYIVPYKQLIIIFLVVLFIAITITLLINRRLTREIDIHSDDLPLYVRDGIHKDEADHDVNLKK